MVILTGKNKTEKEKQKQLIKEIVTENFSCSYCKELGLFDDCNAKKKSCEQIVSEWFDKVMEQEKWHDLRKANDDLPLNTDPVLCLGSTGFIVCKYISGSWVDNQKIELIPKYIEIYKWCEIEDTEE